MTPASQTASAQLLAAAVEHIGGSARPGQQQMAEAVTQAIANQEHLLVQAGTGTGKSLAYLVPLVAHAQASGTPAVVATATLALQSQIMERDLPRLAGALRPHLQRPMTYGVVKGRSNYLCLQKLGGGYPDEEADTLFAEPSTAQSSRIGEQVVRLREWAKETETGERDDLIPGVLDAAWRQVSVTARECMGQSCPMVSECFVEKARAQAQDCDLIVTNHAFMAIDAFDGRRLLPEHDVLVVDEAHELVDRVTATITNELTPGVVRSAAKKARKADSSDQLDDAALALENVLDTLEVGRFSRGIPDALAVALGRCRDTARAVLSELKPERGSAPDGGRQSAQAAVEEVFDIADRILDGRDLDVVWVSEWSRSGKSYRALYVAPMSVATLVRDKVFNERTVVLTSATLELGGSFDSVAGSVGLRGAGAPEWTSLDVGSPFDYPKQAMAYVPLQLPAPGRDGLAPETLDEIEALIRASGGRALGLFSSRRAAEQAAEEMRDRFVGPKKQGITILCQGDDQLPTLVRQFAEDAQTCLFGTMSLWQGVDVPGSACQLVIIDRIPFPRPDDPLASARTQEIGRRGGNGFMSVSATHAALRLAQGAGRLVRRSEDKGVVAFLDTRMRTARYAGFLQSSLPPFWPTTDRELVLGALTRLNEQADAVLPVQPARASVAKADDAAEPGAEPTVLAPAAPAPSDAPRTAVTDGQGWTADEDDELSEGLTMDVSVEELAEHLEKSVAAVTARMGQLGLDSTQLTMGEDA